MPRRIAGVLMAAGLQLVALVLAHELVYLARYGSLYGEALVHSGHGDTWSAAVGTSLALGGILALAAVLRLARLGYLVRLRSTSARGGGRHAPGLRPGSLLRSWLRIGLRIALLAVVLLTLQENLERGAFAGHAFDAGLLLTPEYAGGLWITIAVGLAVGLVAALFRWRQAVLQARLRALRPSIPRRPAPVRRPLIDAHRPNESLLGRRSALRAPPAPVAT